MMWLLVTYSAEGGDPLNQQSYVSFSLMQDNLQGKIFSNIVRKNVICPTIEVGMLLHKKMVKWCGTVSIDSVPIIRIHFQCLRDKPDIYRTIPSGYRSIYLMLFDIGCKKFSKPYFLVIFVDLLIKNI